MNMQIKDGFSLSIFHHKKGFLDSIDDFPFKLVEIIPDGTGFIDESSRISGIVVGIDTTKILSHSGSIKDKGKGVGILTHETDLVGGKETP